MFRCITQHGRDLAKHSILTPHSGLPDTFRGVSQLQEMQRVPVKLQIPKSLYQITAYGTGFLNKPTIIFHKLRSKYMTKKLGIVRLFMLRSTLLTLLRVPPPPPKDLK